MEKFKKGDWVLAINEDNKWIFKLEKNGKFSTHLGEIDHNKIINLPIGIEIKLNHKNLFLTKPRLVDFINLKIKRESQIIYPKDSSAMVFFGDLKEGQKVLEIGIGSGALSLAILKEIGSKGRLVVYDYDQRMIENGKKNIEMIFKNYKIQFKRKDVYQGIEEKTKFDRIFIDIPAPAKIVKFLYPIIKNSGIVINYCLQADQLKDFVVELKKNNFYIEEVFETMKRDWLVDEKRVRAKEIIRGYSAFITIARPIIKS